MPTISLTDNFGLVIDASPEPNVAAIFSKYLKNAGPITAFLHNAKPIRGIQIGQDPFTSQSIGVSFTQPVSLGVPGVELTINPQLSGTLEIVKGKWLFDADDDAFGDGIPIPDPGSQAFLSAGLEASLDVSISDSSGVLQFGFANRTNIVFKNYRLFPLTEEAVPALQTTFQNFVVPGDLEDVESMTPGSIATVEGTGSLKFTATANLLSAVNPLAALSTSVLLGALNVQEGGCLKVGAAYTLTGEYQIRVQRLAGRKFQLGYEKKRGSDFDLSVAADLGVSASFGQFDLIQRVLQTVSADAVPDQSVFQQAGLSDDQISTIAAALKVGIERDLELSLKGELDSIDTVSTAFSYRIDLDVLDATGKKAVRDALRGDLTGLEGSVLNGVTPLKSIFSTLRQGRKVLKINLLGIFNYGSVSTLFQKGTIIVDRESGAVTIADQVGANRIQFTSANFAQDSAKLRKVLAMSFLATATYRSSKTVLQAPSLSSQYWFFEFHQSGNISNIQSYLQTAEALALLSPQEVTGKLQQVRSVTSFGQASIYADSHYDDTLFRSLFLNNDGEARSETAYQTLGRQAMASLILPGSPINSARLRPMVEEHTWQSMLQWETGNFPSILEERGFDPAYVPTIRDDFIAITWWAGAMHEMGGALAQLLDFMGQQSGVKSEDPEFIRLRRNLDLKLASIAANTHDHFAQPWGMVVMDLASGRKSATSLRISCPRLSLVFSRTA
ncbi:MAG TPA: hypothetical protein VMX16_04005 [Terriglobia bacterium]|nr:hypothetical protein [Terriglobia bacterium]